MCDVCLCERRWRSGVECVTCVLCECRWRSGVECVTCVICVCESAGGGAVLSV